MVCFGRVDWNRDLGFFFSVNFIVYFFWGRFNYGVRRSLDADGFFIREGF